jgi:hypothetical protein
MTFFPALPLDLCSGSLGFPPEKNKANSGWQLEMNIKEIRPHGSKKARARTLLLLSGGWTAAGWKAAGRAGGGDCRTDFESVFSSQPGHSCRPKKLKLASDSGLRSRGGIELIEHPRYGYGRNLNPVLIAMARWSGSAPDFCLATRLI